MKTLSNLVIWGALVLGVLPLSRILIKRRHPGRGQGAHARRAIDILD